MRRNRGGQNISQKQLENIWDDPKKVITIKGRFKKTYGYTHKELWALIRDCGGILTTRIQKRTTHLVLSGNWAEAVNDRSKEVKNRIGIRWLLDSQANQGFVDEAKYQWGSDGRTIFDNDSRRDSNFIYVRTFTGWPGQWYAFVTCSPSQKGLHKVVLKNGKPSGLVLPSPGFYLANALFSKENPAPSFFHTAPESQGPTQVKDIKYFNHKYIIQWARDDIADIEPLDLDLEGGSTDGATEEAAKLAIWQTNEDQDGFQRAFVFGDGPGPFTWANTTTFYPAYLGNINIGHTA